jgi:hypothetical protein
MKKEDRIKVLIKVYRVGTQKNRLPDEAPCPKVNYLYLDSEI